MQYKIIQHSDPQIVVNRVNDEIKNGWVPLGNVSVSTYFHPGAGSPCHHYVQAITHGKS